MRYQTYRKVSFTGVILSAWHVVTTQGYDLGHVSDIMETGANDVLVVKANLKDGFGKKERLIPYLMTKLSIGSTENKQICVDWDPGF